jgi:hypothetical protein
MQSLVALSKEICELGLDCHKIVCSTAVGTFSKQVLRVQWMRYYYVLDIVARSKQVYME